MRLIRTLMTIAIGLGLFLIMTGFMKSNSVARPSFWEPIFRSYDEGSMVSSRSFLMSVILKRFRKYLVPYFNISERKSFVSMEYLETTKLLNEMVTTKDGYVKVFTDETMAYIFSLKNIRMSNNFTTKSTQFPIYGKIFLFSMPLDNLLKIDIDNKSKSDESLELHKCWESYIPGIPFIFAFSSDNKNIAITYQIVAGGGLQYRIRYFNNIGCGKKSETEISPDDFEEYIKLTENHQDKLTEDFDDLYTDTTAYFSSLAVSHNKLAYSLFYDTDKFHVLEKNPITKTWKEKQGAPEVERSKNLYEFCHDLYMVEKSNTTMIIAQSFIGNSLNHLFKDINIYEMINFVDQFSVNFPIIPSYNSLIAEERQFSNIFEFPSIDSVHTINSHFFVNENKTEIFMSRNQDRELLMPLPFGEKVDSFNIQTLKRWNNIDAITATKDLSLVVTYSKKDHGFYFYANKNNGN